MTEQQAKEYGEAAFHLTKATYPGDNAVAEGMAFMNRAMAQIHGHKWIDAMNQGK